ncbi:deoxyribodipyrimidine photo-lyase [Spirilliplanes yamanashiensis]|uniref:Deoxyribodipyrimidine photo-lyase n=1 Tax=Spirilliplanes yamanashiensis TaxID=42233 RepID=A0A8J3Y6L4_9ACTN|nr:deoxyribodipyrimidine photo-lyase [Spirilliplanes yamanashiensis]
MLFTRDLRVHDNPALAATCANAERVVPLFVLDPGLLGRSANRDRFLHQALADLRDGLRARGGDLVIRRGDPVTEAMRVARETGAEGIALAADVTSYAKRRLRRLEAAAAEERVAVRTFPGVTVVDPGALRPAGGDHYRVFSPYHRAWAAAAWRDEVRAPSAITLPDGLSPGEVPEPPPGDSPDAAHGGETEARKRLRRWRDHVGDYAEHHNDLPADDTSRLSPYLRFGCVSPLSVATAVRDLDGAEPFVRQLAWRDFYYQVTDRFPKLSTEPYRRSGDSFDWRYDADAMTAWQQGHTGVPVVDAGMRQLLAEGWMHNRARLITAAFLTKHLGLDWRDGVAHFFRLLLDGDVPNNSGNWQWVAGTGNDTRPYRRFNPIRQALRFDPDGTYVRRHVPELAGLAGPAVHQPWRLAGVDYPKPLESHRDEAVWLRP